MGVLPLACTYGESARCLELCGERLSEWMSLPASAASESPFDPWVRPDLYCAGVKQLGEDGWQFMLEQFRANWDDDEWEDR